MTIRYEANPPKIVEEQNMEEVMSKFDQKIQEISSRCDSIHLTESVLGHARVSPIEAGIRLKNKIPNMPITSSLRVRDKNFSEVEEFVSKLITIGFNGVLALKGDPSQNGKPESDLIPSNVIKRLNENGVGKKIDLYLSISNNPNFSKIGKKLDAKPKGFVTQVIQNMQQIENIVDNLKPQGFAIIPILLYPSDKNEKSAKFLNLDLAEYRQNFDEFVKQTQKLTGDILLTSPNDFQGLSNFMQELKNRI